MTGLNKADEKLSFLLRMREHYDVELRKLKDSNHLTWDRYGIKNDCGTYLCAFGSMAESDNFPEIEGVWHDGGHFLPGKIETTSPMCLRDIYGDLFGELDLTPDEIEVRLGCPVESLFGVSDNGDIDDRIAVMDEAIAVLTEQEQS